MIEKKELKKLDLFIQYALAAGVEAVEDAKIDFTQVDPTRAGALVGSGIGGILSILEWHRVLLERGPEPDLPVLRPVAHRQHGGRPALHALQAEGARTPRW